MRDSVYPARVIPAFVMHCVNGTSCSSSLYTDSVIIMGRMHVRASSIIRRSERHLHVLLLVNATALELKHNIITVLIQKEPINCTMR